MLKEMALQLPAFDEFNQVVVELTKLQPDASTTKELQADAELYETIKGDFQYLEQ